MYLHCRHGFVEADAWDGQPVPRADMQSDIDALAGAGAGAVIVVRARCSDTLDLLIEPLPRARLGGVLPLIALYQSPQGWDYEWRCFLTATEWGSCLAAVAADLDYRNFKHTMQHESPREYPLAYAIWEAANRHVQRDRAPNEPPHRSRCIACDGAGFREYDRGELTRGCVFCNGAGTVEQR